jgi:hypothetical protein
MPPESARPSAQTETAACPRSYRFFDKHQLRFSPLADHMRAGLHRLEGRQVLQQEIPTQPQLKLGKSSEG